jgi:hypothetical protein
MKNDARFVGVFPVSMRNCNKKAIPPLPFVFSLARLTQGNSRPDYFTKNRFDDPDAPNGTVTGKYAVKTDITIHAP